MKGLLFLKHANSKTCVSHKMIAAAHTTTFITRVLFCLKSHFVVLAAIHHRRGNGSQPGLLGTYSIPGCIGRGVRLRSESSSSGAGAGGVWKSGNVSRQNVHHKCFTAKCSRQMFHGKMFTANVHTKRHYVIAAKALDGIWPVGHACAVLCWGTASGGGCLG